MSNLSSTTRTYTPNNLNNLNRVSQSHPEFYGTRCNIGEDNTKYLYTGAE